MTHATANEAHRNRIKDIADKCGSRNDGDVLDLAARNLDNRQAAFWTSHGSNNAAAGIFNFYANQRASIIRALDDVKEWHPHHRWDNRNFIEKCVLDAMLPLNSAAETDLASAYDELAFPRSRRELHRRTERIECPHMRASCVMETYRGFTISKTEPWPLIPRWHKFTFVYTHEDYDGADDSNDRRHGHKATVAGCKAEIDDLIEAEAEVAAWEAAHPAALAKAGA